MARVVIQDRRHTAIVAQLVKARKAAGLTQEALAELIGVQQSHVSKIERNERYLNVVQFAEICRALNLKPAMLLRHIRGTGKAF